MPKNYIFNAWRNIVHGKTHSVINVFGLSLGLTCAMLIMLYTSDDLNFDQFHHNVDNIYRITGKLLSPDGNVTFHGGKSSVFEGPQYADVLPAIDQYVRIDENYMDIRVKGDMISQRILSADKNFFSFFSFPLLRGNLSTAINDPTNIVLTEKAAIRFFGTDDVLGEIIPVARDGILEAYTVTGVAKDPPENSSIQFEVVKLLTTNAVISAEPLERINGTVNTFISVHPATDIAKLEEGMKGASDELIAEAVKVARSMGFEYNAKPALQPMTDIHFNQAIFGDGSGVGRRSDPRASQILVIIAAAILIIACINFINITIARSAKRAKEIGIRKVIGGSRQQLIKQFLGESFMLCVIAFVSAIALMQSILPLFNELINKQLSIGYLFTIKLALGFFTLLLITGLIAGSYPAFVMASYNPIVVLTQRFKVGRGILQKGLVIFQFGLATMLIFGTFTISQQYEYLTSQDLGYDPDNVVTIGKSGISLKEVGLLRNTLTSNPGIESVSVLGGTNISAKINGGEDINLNCDFVDPHLIPIFKIKLLQGRNFSPEFPSDTTKAIIVNESFVKEAGWKDPIGQVVNMFPFDGTADRTVIGVVKDWNNTPLTQPISPEALVPDAGPFNDGYSAFLVRIVPGSESRSLPFIEKNFCELFPINSYEMAFQTDGLRTRYESEARWKKIIFFASIVTVVISCIGLLGLTMITAERRLKELSIRKVLGATSQNIVALLSGSFLRLIFVAMLIGMPLAWYLADRWLSTYPYRFTIQLSMFIEVALILVGISLIITIWHSLKAALRNPVDSLKGG